MNSNNLKNEFSVEKIEGTHICINNENKICINYGKYKLAIAYIFISFYLGLSFNNILINKKSDFKKFESFKNLILNFDSYSQHLEDLILFYIFYDVNNGFYIDVGANDPNIYSVTKAFYERGWYGINIEPLPDKIQVLKKYRKRDINLMLGAGNKEGKLSLKIEGRRSSIFYEKKKQCKSKIININIKTMANICKLYVPNKTDIQFCKIDVEKAEKNVLLGYDFENYRPKIFCIESLTDKKTNISGYKEWENILIEKDYAFAYEFKVNRFYYDKRILSLKDKFKEIDNYIKMYLSKNNKLFLN